MKNIIKIIKNIIAFVKDNTMSILILVVLALCTIMYEQCSRIQTLKSENELLSNNQKAYENENSDLKETNYEFDMTIKQLKASNDTITKELVETKKSLGIKDKNLKAMGYMTSTASKTDTIEFHDTIFKDPSFCIDTLISNEWYSTRLVMEYPDGVIVANNFNSKKELFVSAKKETVNAPKKFVLFRLFQKKHYVTTIDVLEKNPYITNDTERFIKIIE